MGEAKRRKKLDSTYGKFLNLSSTAKEKHSESVLEELFTTFGSELKTLILAQTLPDNFQSICERMTDWFQHKLLRYRPLDRDYILKFILNMSATLGEEFTVKEKSSNQESDVSPILFFCIFQATRNCLTDEALLELKSRLENTLKEFPLLQESTPSLLEQIQL